MRKKTVSETLAERIQGYCKDLIDEYNTEKDPQIRLEIKYDLVRQISKHFILEISRLKDADWRRFCREQIKPMDEVWERISKDLVDQKLAHGELNLQDLELLIAEGQRAEELGRKRLTKSEQKALSKRRTIERLLALAWISNAQLLLGFGALGIALEPLSRLNDILARRFGADLNWILAVAILAAHENLVKKKLVELGINEEEIEKTSRDPRRGFNALMNLLAKQIHEKEKRPVSLSFYKSSALRIVRNKLEHEGYKQKVTKDELLDLLKEITQFEKENFP